MCLHAKHVFSNQFGLYLSCNCVITEKCVFFYNDPSMKNDEQRILHSKLGISTHNLEIERGRHRGLQAKERICKLCLKEVEDEIHFLLKCEALQNVRTPFIDHIINNNNYNFKH